VKGHRADGRVIECNKRTGDRLVALGLATAAHRSQRQNALGDPVAGSSRHRGTLVEWWEFNLTDAGLALREELQQR
jgi:hypothetical protein